MDECKPLQLGRGDTQSLNVAPPAAPSAQAVTHAQALAHALANDEAETVRRVAAEGLSGLGVLAAPHAQALAEHAKAQADARASRELRGKKSVQSHAAIVLGRGLHSSTFQINLSRFCH